MNALYRPAHRPAGTWGRPSPTVVSLAHDRKDDRVTLDDYWKIAHRYWVFLLGFTLAGLALATAFTWTRTPEYTATSKAFVIGITSGQDSNAALSASNVAQEKAVAWSPLVTSEIVATEVIKQLKLTTTPQALAGDITATTEPDLPVITISAKAGSASEAQRVANAVAEQTAKQAKSLDPYSGAQLKTIASAQLPESPSYPKPTTFLPLGALLGLLVGFLTMLVRSRMDTKVRTNEDVEAHLGTSVLGVIPDNRQLAAPGGKISSPRGDFASREALRSLRTNLRFVDVDDEPRSIVVTSARMSEGKSTIASSLAWVLADGNDSPVVLVDADLRRPAVADIFDLDATVGLSQVLAGTATLRDALQSTSRPGLYVLTAGQVPPNPSELLGSNRMRELLSQMSRTHRIILDAPPLLPVTDAALLTASADGAIVVVSAGDTRKEHLDGAAERLEAVGGRLLGSVLNRVNTKRFNRIVYGDPQFGHGAYGTCGTAYETVAPPPPALSRVSKPKGKQAKGKQAKASRAERRRTSA